MTATDYNRSGPRHRFSPIPGWPGGWRLLVTVPVNLIGAENDNTLGQRPGLDTLLYWSQAPEHIRTRYGSYIYGEALDANEQEITFVWNPPRSSVQRLVAVKTIYDAMSYTWPPVLLDGRVIVQDVGGVDKPVNRLLWVEAFTDRSVVKIQTYVSNTPWTEGECRTDLPNPSSIAGDYYGTPVEVPDCLHPEVTIESAANDERETFDWTPDTDADKMGNVQVIPATNHLEWEDHIIDVKTSEVNGLHFRVVTTILAPDMPEPSYA